MDNRRAYRRSSHFNGRAMVSQDGKHWAPADVTDVSSGGLRLSSSVEYKEGDLLWFDLFLEGFLSEIEVQTMGEVRRKSSHAGRFGYGIRFKGLSLEKAIRIDENVRKDRPISGGSYEPD
jgi:hypothetical protein